MQITIYDFIYKSNKDLLLKQFEKYGIDELYLKKHKGKFNTLKIIYDDLSSNSNYYEYLKSIYEKLENYIDVSSDPYEDLFNGINKNTMILKDNSIIIYNFKKRCISPIYCLEMLDDEILETEK